MYLWEECVAIFERVLVTGRDDLAATLTWSARYQVQHVADDIIAVLCGLDSSVTRRQYPGRPFLGQAQKQTAAGHGPKGGSSHTHTHKVDTVEDLDTYAQLVAGYVGVAS